MPWAKDTLSAARARLTVVSKASFRLSQRSEDFLVMTRRMEQEAFQMPLCVFSDYNPLLLRSELERKGQFTQAFELRHCASAVETVVGRGRIGIGDFHF